MGTVNNFQGYTPAGDIIAIILCIIYMFLLQSTFEFRKDNARFFYVANILCMWIAVINLIRHEYVSFMGTEYAALKYILGDIVYTSLILLFVIFNRYLCVVLKLSKHEICIMQRVMYVTWSVYLGVSVVFPMVCFAIHKSNALCFREGYLEKFFTCAYLFYAFISVFIVFIYRKRFIQRIRISLLGVMFVTYLCMLVQRFSGETSFTCITFTFPIVASMFLFYYNAYDVVTGTLDERSFATYLKRNQEQSFSVVSTKFKELIDEDCERVAEFFFNYNASNLIDSCTFWMRDGRMVTIFTNKKNVPAADVYAEISKAYKTFYDAIGVEYKIVFVRRTKKIDSAEDYISLCEMIEHKMQWDVSYIVEKRDIDKFLHNVIVENALKDIHEKMDLNDDRVQAYCQPVFNTTDNSFTTAEALMRIILPDYGIIYPDEFIPIAEKRGYIHTLSKIILHKTCKHLVKLQETGYDIERISVNFAISELKDPDFCDDVINIIKNIGIPVNKIAIELTESRNEQDFERVRRVMDVLQNIGIKFYLDDFGTGYSNFARIIGLPIDIIKFDRSLTIMSRKSGNSKYMVGSFSDIFENSQYQILFEGVEDEEDERRCIEMNAQYLQGYKYSKPIPMRYLYSFLE